MEQYVYKNHKMLRFGYTTGSCAAAAAKAAAVMLLCGTWLEQVSLMTPKGIGLDLALEDITRGDGWVSCAVRKDSGDDPDVTHGILVYAKAEKSSAPGIRIDGGTGVGRVTRKGLNQPVGAAAINDTPRRMIGEEVGAVCGEYEYPGGLSVTISIPRGEELAGRTFNPKIGITGGISVLGTSGIVEPMSEQALIDSIRVEMKMLAANGAEYLLVTPGNYGETFTRSQMEIDLKNSLKCSNYVGETLDCALELKLRGVLLIGHIGKFIKLAGGVMNTHSRYADCRMEILTAHAALAGADKELLNRLMGCITTDEALGHLKSAGMMETVMAAVMKKIEYHLNQRVYQEMPVGAIMFSNEYGVLGQTGGVAELLGYFTVPKQQTEEPG